jgi:LPXTG-motif cell wall-anchored protein
MSRLKFVLVGIGLALMMVAPVSAQAAQTLRIGQKADLGRFIVDAQGRTLYLFTRDNGTTSACMDACLTTWPPLVQASGQPALGPGLGGTVGVAVQADGRRQVTYNGKLLYYYRNDMNPGDTVGQNVGGVWFVVEAVASTAVLPRTGGAALPLGLGAAGLLSAAAGLFLRRRTA